MAKTQNQLLAEALAQVTGSAVGNIVHSKNIKPKQQALLVKQGYLKRIIKGWYLFDADLSAHTAGESALWFESIWSFIAQYLTLRFDDNYWLSAEASLDIHTDNNLMPAQVVIFVKDGTEDIIRLPNEMGLLITRSKTKPDSLVEFHDLKIFSLEMALAKSTPASFKNNPVSMQVALRKADFDKLADALVRLKNIASAGRIIGAFDALGMRAESKKMEAIITSVFGAIKIINPFLAEPVILGGRRGEAASAGRVRILWQQMRQVVIDGFDQCKPEFDFYSRPLDETLAMISELYVRDAYNSLSIEGYRVTPELIERVSKGDWSPDTIKQDKEIKDALAARGYFDAFNNVKASLTEAYHREDLSYLIDVGITQWYTSLFGPCVIAGIVSDSDLAGFRKGPIYIRKSRHVPPASEQLMDCMTALKECIAAETSYPVKAILAHFFLGYIHPFIDGNGRTARFLMNFLFVIGGYGWVIIKQETRDKYMDALEAASSNENIVPFVEFILDTIRNARLEK
ncbi:MAG: Fic family protein [Gammaproteobacteria bacterium]|nr:Fic family protein [Gammaproteobacteria bacterium]